MSDLRDLYQEVILDHSRSPRNFGKPEGANRSIEGFNPLCGDQFTIHLVVEGDVVRDAGFAGAGCAISKASASMMTAMIKGKTIAEVEDLFRRFHDMVTAPVDSAPPDEGIGKLAVFAGVREFPVRVKCATLAWHTMRSALRGETGTVSTE